MTSSVEHERRQLADLAAIGLDWDGDVVRQSERFERYRQAIGVLDERGLVYPCYCTRREIRARDRGRRQRAARSAATRRLPGDLSRSDEHGTGGPRGGRSTGRAAAAHRAPGDRGRRPGRGRLPWEGRRRRAAARRRSAGVQPGGRRRRRRPGGDTGGARRRPAVVDAAPGVAPTTARAADARVPPRAAGARVRRRASRQASRCRHAVASSQNEVSPSPTSSPGWPRRSTSRHPWIVSECGNCSSTSTRRRCRGTRSRSASCRRADRRRRARGARTIGRGRG